MILTVPVAADGTIEMRFGKAPVMAVATVEDGAITDWQTHEVGWDVLHDMGEHGQHHARIVRFLKDNNVERVVFAHMGPPMQNTISKMKLTLVQAPIMDAREAVVAAAQLAATE
jgi:predicted Fe-Mo cluster-binding NifX family protein